ncbi:MAG: DUF2142 domain-containing protein [Chloroflexi bacterium]|nr:DUF2142 domain-containing protein [Chloroflexota bacterium]
MENRLVTLDRLILKPGDLEMSLPIALTAVIVVLYSVIGSLYAINTPLWQAPDEPAHYAYVRQVAEGGCCPLMQPSDWDADALSAAVSAGFPAGTDLNAISYQDHQPPLYYLVASLPYLATGGNPIAIRFLSVAFGAGTVIGVFLIGFRLFPRRPMIGVAAAIFVAFLPQHLAIMGSINNDSLAGIILVMVITVTLYYVGNPIHDSSEFGPNAPLHISHRPHALALGALVGVAYLTKLTIYGPATLAVAAAILWRWRGEGHDGRWLAQQIAWAAGVALLIGGLWWGRNLVVYGGLDLLAQGAHRAAVIGQPLTADLIGQVGLLGYLGQAITTTFNSFFGQFGWMAVPLPRREYGLILAFLIFCAVGLILGWRNPEREPRQAAQRAGTSILAIVAAISLIGYITYNLTFLQLQGRYLFPLLAPLAVLLAVGLSGWAGFVQRRLPKLGKWVAWLPVILLSWWPLYALWALYRHLIPNLS